MRERPVSIRPVSIRVYYQFRPDGRHVDLLVFAAEYTPTDQGGSGTNVTHGPCGRLTFTAEQFAAFRVLFWAGSRPGGDTVQYYESALMMAGDRPMDPGQ